MKLIVKTLAGLEEVLAEEVKELTGKTAEILNRAVHLEGDENDIFTINYLSRLATHVLLVLKEGEVYDEDSLYEFAKDFPWEKYMQLDQTFAISPTISSDRFKHTGFASLKVKDAIADRFRDKQGARPDVDKEAPNIPINIHIFRTQATLSLNTSGRALFQRGYKEMKGLATMNEVLASGLIALSGWKGDTPFFDPMCGTGTLPLEAAMKAKNIPAQKFREEFAFEHFYFLNTSTFKMLKRKHSRPKGNQDIDIFAADNHPEAFRLTKNNIYNAKLQSDIHLYKADFFRTEAPTDKGTLIMNPPYDERMELDDAIEFYKSIGDHFKQAYKGWNAWVISGHLEGIKHLGLKPTAKHAVYNGNIECSFRGYEIY